jgi:hypothetical protein
MQVNVVPSQVTDDATYGGCCIYVWIAIDIECRVVWEKMKTGIVEIFKTERLMSILINTVLYTMEKLPEHRFIATQ